MTASTTAEAPQQPASAPSVPPVAAVPAWAIHVLYAVAIVAGAALIALGLSSHGTSGDTVVVPGSGTVRIIIDEPLKSDTATERPRFADPRPGGVERWPGSGAGHRCSVDGWCEGGGAGQPVWCTPDGCSSDSNRSGRPLG